MENKAAARSVLEMRQDQAILIVDDMPANLEVAMNALDGQGYEVLIAQDGDEAVKRATRVLPDLILLDVMMPGVDGIETCRRLKQVASTRDIPVIFMTALSDVEHKLQGFAAGGVDYVTKPFQTEELLARVKTHLALRATQRQLAGQNARLQASESRYRRLFETSLDGILLVDADAETVIDVNSALIDMLGFERSHFIGQRLGLLKPFKGQSATSELVAQFDKGASVHRIEHWSLERAAGSRVDVEVSMSGYEVDLRRVVQINLRDITLRKQAEARVQYMALHDALTGLPNRRLLHELLLKAIARARRERRSVAVLLLDLDHFKRVNDSMGHHVGDALLETVAKRLRSCLRESDIPARLGGDEFVVALPDIGEEREIVTIAEKILAALSQPAELEGVLLDVRASIGISRWPEDGAEPGDLLRAADTALYQAKSDGRGRFRFYSVAINQRAQMRVGLLAELRQALPRGELVLHYQPRFRQQDGVIAGVDALLRWQHPERGLMHAGELMPLLQESGMMMEIECWVLEEACRQVVEWTEAGNPALQLGVNLSVEFLLHRRVVTVLQDILNQTRLPAAQLEIEFTEVADAEDPVALAKSLRSIKTLGVKLALDDFARGWSALSCLWRLPIDRVKIDRSLIADVTEQTGAAKVMRAMLNLFSDLGLSAVAQGIETQSQLAFLNEQRNVDVQGYLSGPAVPAASFDVLLERGYSGILTQINPSQNAALPEAEVSGGINTLCDNTLPGHALPGHTLTDRALPGRSVESVDEWDQPEAKVSSG